MRAEQLRAILQAAFVLLFMPALFVFGLGCYCGSCYSGTGTDYSNLGLSNLFTTRDVLVGDGTVYRYHDAAVDRLVATAGEALAANQALPDAFIGVRVPAASVTSSAAGQLLPGAEITVRRGRETQVFALKEDAAQSGRLNQLFPPPDNTEWTALVISDTHALDDLLDSAIDLRNVDGWLHYVVDFGGSDSCNGCEVQLVGCFPSAFAALLPPAVLAATPDVAGTPVACTQPVSTFITLYDNNSNPLPGAPVVAAFGLWGSQNSKATSSSVITVPLTLDHTGTTTLTFDLAPVQSALGWSYNWRDSRGAAITQIDVPRRQAYPPPLPNLQVTASGLPTCTQAIDVLTVRATNTVTPSIAAETQAYVQVTPDIAACPVADIATRHVQATAVISGGDSITYTLTISNLTNAVQDALVQQTLDPAGAVHGASLPAGCTLTGAVVTCQISDIAAQGVKTVTVAIRTRNSFTGNLLSTVKASPVGATDAAFLDNVHGPLTANVQSSGRSDGLYLPIITKQP